MILPAHEDFGTRSQRSDIEEKLCFEEFLQATEYANEELLEDLFDLDLDNLSNFIAEDDRIFNSKTGFRLNLVLVIFKIAHIYKRWH